MWVWSATLLVTAVAGGANNTQRIDVSASLRSIVEAEHSFGKAVAAKGVRDGFLEYLADDAVVFHPGPVSGKEWTRARPPSTGYLTWEPIVADVSRTGDLGYTTGPWEYRPKGVKDQPSAFGNYVTLWNRQPGEPWRVILDIGTGNPQPRSPAKSFRPGALTAGGRVLVRPAADPDSERAIVLDLERQFSAAVASGGVSKAYATYAAPSLRLHREGNSPITESPQVRAYLDGMTQKPAWEPIAARVSRADDLAYSYGSYALSPSGEEGSYLHIWKRQPNGDWKVVLDLLTPHPKTPSK
jgi:ketosteroid isomerase-like protein